MIVVQFQILEASYMGEIDSLLDHTKNQTVPSIDSAK